MRNAFHAGSLGAAMKHIDESLLETDLLYRFEYLCEFMGFADDDVKTIQGAAPLLAPLVPALVDAVYDKLHSYDATWRHFVPRQEGYSGELPTSVEALTMDHPQIQFRKQHLGRYLEKLVTSTYDKKMVQYLDFVGQMHTPDKGNRNINVPLVQMDALMGFVADAINGVILTSDLPMDAKTKTVRAFSKLLWIQNDLIVRHYAKQAA